MATPTTKTFDAVEMSRRLREDTSRKLATLTRAQRLALLNAHLRSTSMEDNSTCVLREDPPKPSV